MKLHLGCGERFIEGYKHIDIIERDHIDHVAYVDHLPFIEDNCVEVIYACHLLEHFKRKDFMRVLAEWYRVLRPGGVLRISVPDFEQAIKIYQETGDLEFIMGMLYGGQNYLYNMHYNTFDFKKLSTALKEIGFTAVARYDWRETEHAHVDDFSQAYYPHMDKDNGIQHSLNLEAIK